MRSDKMIVLYKPKEETGNTICVTNTEKYEELMKILAQKICEEHKASIEMVTKEVCIFDNGMEIRAFTVQHVNNKKEFKQLISK